MKKEYIFEKASLIRYLLDKNNYLEFVANGNSMLPAISEGQIIRVSNNKNKRYLPNLIVLFCDNEALLTVHRIIDRQGDVVFLKGDNSSAIDTIHVKQIIGEVIKGIANTLYGGEPNIIKKYEVISTSGYQKFTVFLLNHRILKIYISEL